MSTPNSQRPTPNSHRLRQGYGESAEALRAKAELPTPNTQLPTPKETAEAAESAATRRDFIATLGFGVAGACFAWPVATEQKLKFGYAAITWQGKDLDAIRDVSAVGFRGIQLRSPIVKEY